MAVTQGRLADSPTLGWMIQSLWDWSPVRGGICVENQARKIIFELHRSAILDNAGATEMTLLTELQKRFGSVGFYKDAAPNGASDRAAKLSARA